jgi:hypothetical protein
MVRPVIKILNRPNSSLLPLGKLGDRQPLIAFGRRRLGHRSFQPIFVFVVELFRLDRQAVESWQGGELIQNAFPDMTMGDRELLISGTHAACWDKLFPREEEDEDD